MSKLKPFNFLKILAKYWKIVTTTLSDDRVPKLLKRSLIGVIIYVISPIDILPDVLPVLGQLDDIWLIVAVLEWIKSNLPPQVIDEIDGKVIKGN